jgi:hypothetical protein
MGLRGDWLTVRGPLATGRAPPAERWVLAGLRVAFEGGTWLIELGTSKGVIQADFTNATTPLDVRRKRLVATRLQIWAADTVFPDDSGGSLRPGIDD